jgi:4-alpha-glucanotransferase
MKFPRPTHFLTGILVPVSALRTLSNAAVGEFYDLMPLGDWCSSVGLDLIQILPVNDTGSQSSPYSALSAFALHPVYLHLPDVPEIAARPELCERVQEIRNAHNSAERVAYQEVLNAKEEILAEAYAGAADSIQKDPSLASWTDANPWVREYAVFKTLKKRYTQASWRHWPENQNPDPELIRRFWDDKSILPDLLYHAWVQFLLEGQMRRVVDYLSRVGVLLKGDLPILMNEDSVDLWYHRDNFNLRMRAGAPPDMFSDLGQNWGFPIYDWETLGRDDYAWWRARLHQADKFYNAYRIDHVLGFFRIWAVPDSEFTGILGRFLPSRSFSRQELNDAGFSDDRIRWLLEPHVSGDRIRDLCGPNADEVRDRVFDRLGEEDLYLFRPGMSGEKTLSSLPFDHSVREFLLEQYRDRALVSDGNDEFYPAWTFRSCSRYQILSDQEKESFEALYARTAEENEKIWEETGRRLLRFMNTTVDMHACAEDLGVIPRSVPDVLGGLGIYSLKLPRWNRLWDKPDQPFIPLTQYPRLSVCAASVHDTTTLREWWETEDGDQAKDLFWKVLGLNRKKRPRTFTPEAAREVIRKIMETNSEICVFQIQDLFAASPDLRTSDPSAERVNIPATYNDFNWTYRIITNLENLAEDTSFRDTLTALVKERKRRPL